MKILSYPTTIENPTAVALGRFDGVHSAHKAVILGAVNNAENLVPTVFTFCDNPGKAHHSLLTTEKEKHHQIANLGVKLLMNVRFETLRNLSAEEFVSDVLCGLMNAKAVYCGYNYRFGKGASADVTTLRRLCAVHGISVTCTDEFSTSGMSVSSTTIRRLLCDGNVRTAAELLGRNYTLSGEVIHGNALGRTIQIPTLNIEPPKEKQLPLFGVYATRTTIDGKTYKSITNIGVKPTVGSDSPTVETYLLDAQGDFYCKDVKVELIDFLREERKFSSLEELKSTITKDIEKAHQILL
ncbi:MAG: bifunctional riboflavin kinase/FAD synthetase [Ruminococcus sp.]|nr:bifunctional riboflavin kinase/FAD synthetase [Ruminococcus sp.]